MDKSQDKRQLSSRLDHCNIETHYINDMIKMGNMLPTGHFEMIL